LACVLSNPFEVVKTRTQVQGELAQAGSRRVYGNAFSALVVLAKAEGLHGVQKGLVPGLGYQIGLNGVRFGCFPIVRHKYVEAGVPGGTWLAGATVGMFGGALGMPFYLVKCRMQTRTSNAATAVGYQHAKYEGVVGAFRAIVHSNGVGGLYRGVDAMVMRVGMGSSVQLPVFTLTKEAILDRWPQARDWPILVSFVSSMLAGAGAVTVMNPWDVVTTRMCNQPEDGSLYRSSFDCLRKTYVAEGLAGFAKGWWAHWFRLGPHTTYCFVFLEALKGAADRGGVLQ